MRTSIELLFTLAWVAVGQPSDSEIRWREDIDAFVKGLSASGTAVDFSRGISSRGQKDFEKLYPKSTFDPAIASLKESLANLADAEIVLRLMQIVASAHVAHNTIYIPKAMGFERRIPIAFSWFGDQMAVTAATPAFKEALGLRVLKLGSMTPEQLLEAESPFISHENDVWLRSTNPGFLTRSAALEHFHLIDPDGRVSLTLDRPGREPLVLDLPFDESQAEKIGFRAALNIAKPLYMEEGKKFYWHRYLADSQTMFIQYNACANDKGQSFGDFTHSVAADMRSHPVKQVVLDLRFNGGGDSRVIGPLKKVLASGPQPVYVLIGPGTFSSALDNAIELKQELHVTLVGESTGGKPSGYGEVKHLTLPNSKLVVQYTSKYFGAPKGLDEASLKPDIAAPITLNDALAGRDPALDAVIAVK